jgi:hypothetical protein
MKDHEPLVGTLVPVRTDLLLRLRAHLVNERQSWIECGSQLEWAADGTCRPVPGTLDAEHRDIVTAITLLIEGLDEAMAREAQAFVQAEADRHLAGLLPLPSLLPAALAALGAWCLVLIIGLGLWFLLSSAAP